MMDEDTIVSGKWADTLSLAEAEFTKEAMQALESAPWARPLLRRLEQCGGICAANMPLLFEVRIAYAFYLVGVTASYEHMTGAGKKSADFRIHSQPEWIIEAVRLGESRAIRTATKESGDLFSLCLSTNAKDGRQSEEGELIKAMERVEVKASKFPSVVDGTFHVIVVDVRGFLGHGGDHDDYREMAYGTGAALAPENAHWWNGQPIFGLFDSRNCKEAAQLVQQRVHFLGFVREQAFNAGEIQQVGFYLPNPTLFRTNGAAASVFGQYPLRHP
jgi:hypothetical protein